MTKRKWAWGIGIAALIGLVLWMRALASWRPQTFAKVSFNPTRSLFSRDGKRLIVADASGNSGDKQIFSWKSGAVDVGPESLREFDADFYGAPTFPRVWFDEATKQLVFSPDRNRSVALEMRTREASVFRYEWRSSTAWSKQRGEIYGAMNNAIWIWNWKDGKLKKRANYKTTNQYHLTFSPHAKWLLAYEKLPDGNGFLRCYDVQTGKMVKTLHQTTDLHSFGFSPDGRLFWFVQNPENTNGDFNVLRADNWKWLWSADCAGPVKWLSDGRIGIVQKQGFEWRLRSGRKVRQLPGPSAGISDWTLSPDGEWIYSVERSGVIRRWRAR